MLTEPPLLSDADHCTAITAARAQLKDKEKAVDLIQQILQNQNILIDGGVIQRTALKPTMDGLKTAEAALAEATKRFGGASAAYTIDGVWASEIRNDGDFFQYCHVLSKRQKVTVVAYCARDCSFQENFESNGSLITSAAY
ncbi:hypothetical protein CDAR_258761 [Caerostris darwini]|uniref:Uncharacterized protein n=1 Tax=Caerostris darwini TaxID=1538125 RepID=A0AAV4U854_9ARAC|nr:hypothetical protein CDAR_258761 [Caerostris darwini]